MIYRGIRYKVHRRSIKYPRLEFRTGSLDLILPPSAKPKEILEKHRTWILKKQQFITDCLSASSSKHIVLRSESEFRRLALSLVESFSRGLRVSVNAVFFRKMRTKWASCSAKANVTLNSHMRSLPEILVEYVLYHEMVHLLERRHNERFWNLISRRFPDHGEKEKSLFSYWFLVQGRIAGSRGQTPHSRKSSIS
ncbi:M48 family peptidase [candidate division TA06 bacterium]|uniref:M48 family peptidase n=1 Tax=candidate division TA06 bacterium TaxID=2250710 RepID=A0A523XMY1_UNCT6|nr:MAG: M48 family peptidase [candidate division TA06 bacterium]